MTAHPKPVVVKDEKYLAWLRTQLCWFARFGNCNPWTTMGSGYSEVSHLDGKSRADRCLPSCGGHHRTNMYAWHSGQKTFCAFYNLDKDELIREAEQLYAAYHRGKE